MGDPPLQEGAMSPRNSTLTAPQVHRCAAVILQDHLEFGDHGPKCRASMLFTLFAVRGRSDHVALRCLPEPCATPRPDEAARLALIATLPNFAELQRRLNAALAGNLPRSLRRSPQRVAADLVLIPYHSQPQSDPDGDLPLPGQERDQPLPRLRHADVIRHGYRCTVAFRPRSLVRTPWKRC